MEDSKMVRQVYIVQKMSPTHRIQMKYKILGFTKFVNFFHEIKGPKWQILKSQNLSLLLRFFTSKTPQIRPIENFFAILKQHVYAGNWSAKNREGLICRIKKCVREIDMNMIIKMFDNLPPKIIKAKNHGLDSLL